MRLADRLGAVITALEQTSKTGQLHCSTDSTFFMTLMRTLRECHDQARTIERPPALPGAVTRIEVDRVIEVARAHLMRRELIHPTDVDAIAATVIAQHEILLDRRPKGAQPQ
jgi:hypothetical protein